MSDSKKLVRGLKDISPLFGAAAEVPQGPRAPEVQIVGVSSPDADGDSLLLNTFFASQIASPDKACNILSVLSRHAKALLGTVNGRSESFGAHLERCCLYWDELRELVNRPAGSRTEGVLQSRDIFLDFEYRQLLHYEKILALLDKWVLVVKPSAESLTEAYKMMKVGLAINPQLECYMTLSGQANEAQGLMVFERFSDFVLRHLDVELGWLGWMDLADPARYFSSALHTELLKYQSWNVRPNLQKFMLAEWIESLEKKSRKVFVEVPQ